MTWLDGSESSNFLPWDSVSPTAACKRRFSLGSLCPHPDRAVLLQASNQPNDCDGPKQPETCIFLGPYGAWFDFQW